MKQSLKDFFEGVSIKNTLFLIIWTIGILAWIYFGVSFTETRAEANETWEMVQQIQEQQKENKTKEVGQSVGGASVEASSTEKQDTPIKAKAEDLSSAPASGIEEIIYETFGKDEYQTARAVAFAESRLNEKATNTNTNGTTDCGVFQINSIHGLKDCQDPVKNIEYAKQLFDRSGWYPWVAWKSGAYKKFLASI